MKKLILSIVIVVFITVGAKAQNDSKSTSLSVGVSADLPVSSPSVFSFSMGINLQADFAVSSSVKITGSLGYQNYWAKSSNANDVGSSYFVPALIGVKGYLGDKAYVHLQAGYAFAQFGGAFGYAPSIGYYFSPKLDASLRYLSFTIVGESLSTIGIRLAYNL